MGFIGTGLSKLGAASAQQLGIAAAASLSVMAVSFSAIAYQGYVTEKKQEQAHKKSTLTAESRFQEVFYNGNYEQAPAVLGENEIAGTVSDREGSGDRALPAEGSADDTNTSGGQGGSGSTAFSANADESSSAEATTANAESTGATEAESATEESTETITEIVDGQNKKTVKNNIQESVAPAQEASSANAENASEAATAAKPVAD